MQVLPFVAEHKCFALKGGTAINLFVREFPRLSVDIDLVYLPVNAWDEALLEITAALDKLSASLQEKMLGIKITEAYKAKGDTLRLIVSRRGVQIKIELSPVICGTVFEPKMMTVCDSVENEFGYAEIAMVALPDLYAGKICAALDRQHPRDLFDVKWLLENEGLTDDLRKTLLVYISSHNRPMAELLRPQLKDISAVYEGEFADMAEKNVPLAELEAVRERLIAIIHEGLTTDEKQFLLSFKNRSPNWTLLGLEGINELPAIKWKQINLAKMTDVKHKQAYNKLKDVLGV